MVYTTDKGGTVCATVVDSTGSSGRKFEQIQLSAATSVQSVFDEVATIFNFAPDVFELALQQTNGDVFVLNEHKDKTFGELEGLNLSGRLHIALSFLRHARNAHKNYNRREKNDEPPQPPPPPPPDNNGAAADDDLILGASASPTIGDVPTTSGCSNPYGPEPGTSLALMNVDFSQQQKQHQAPRLHLKPEPCNYVGLVNQAMTCYLNSLLQALFMTPEFRNALYNWEFDGQNQEKSIPFQLQKLFLNLQTSTKSAVETTDLTHSFGWDLQAAWEQHDIQELCRVMFDALEQTFKNTRQSNLINDLYEGKMLDYVKCLECRTEKSREDTFLDIPLPVRPFGSAVAYNSVEEALRGFVQPETLDGNNQYFCERCDKKCDAHKGLKFIKFPYLLTLHLKRFDFDYQTMHRIKLNDKVVFPEVLNLNSFVPNVISMLEEAAGDVTDGEAVPVTRCDDCSTTDSGSALDDESISCQGTDASSMTMANGQDEACRGGGGSADDDDEGIDVSSGGAGGGPSSHNHLHENEKNRAQEPKGPYQYELFSIMIHSGSASGGHYYAYIKDFQKEQWFCFNDQSVGRITEDDIQKTYGGGPPRGYYSGAYTSSTNAYMLMYRQIDKTRNCEAMTVEQFPPHIERLLREMREKEESDRLAKEKEHEMFKLRIYCNHPSTNQLLDAKIFAFVENSLAEIASDAYDKFKLKGLVDLEDCRLVAYNKLYDCIECSFDGDDPRFSDPDIKEYTAQAGDWFLEVRRPGAEFESYRPGGVRMKAYLIHLESDEVTGPVSVRINAGETVGELKIRLGGVFALDATTLRVILETGSGEACPLDDDDLPVKFDAGSSGYKLYAASAQEDPDKQQIIDKMYKVIDLFAHIVNIDVVLPENDLSTLESLSIPSLETNQTMDGMEMASGDLGLCRPLGTQQQNEMEVQNGDQSNSEEGSLSDCDVTLTGDAPTDADCSEAVVVDYAIHHNTDKNGLHDDDDSTAYYFKVISTHDVEPSVDQDNAASRCCAKVMVDKRTTIARLKKNLEPTVGVPVNYFKLYRQYPNQNVELTNLTETLSTSKDGERLLVKLGRVLKRNEMSGKVYLLNPDGAEPFNYLFECVVAKGQTVGSLKREILLHAKKQHMIDIPYDRCRLRRKNWKNPSKVYLDDQKFGDDISVSNKFEVIVQELKEPERLLTADHLPVFVKRWSPSKLELSNFDEVVLAEPTMDELKRRLSERFDVPAEFVDVALLKSYFPCDMNVLEVDTLEWNGDHVDAYSLQGREDACVFFFRDRREQLKWLSAEERKEIQQRENSRLGRFNTKAVFSPSRRERGLKIYLDNDTTTTSATTKGADDGPGPAD